MSLEGGRRRAIGIDLQHRARTAVLANEYLADPGAVPQALAGLAVLRNARADFQAAPLGQPVQRRPGRIEPAVEAVEPVQQASREFVLDPAAGDLPEPGPVLAVANPDVVDEGVMHVAGKDQVVTRRARVAEDVHHHRGRAAMGHPVFRIDQQRLADPAEELLHALDQLDPEHRRRRHDDRRLFAEQILLEFTQRLPVHQPGGPAQVALAAPAAGARVEDDQGRAARQPVVPVLEVEQGIEQAVLLGAGQAAVCRGALHQGRDRRQPFAAMLRVVAPALAEQVGEQGVADDPPGERMAVGGQLPARGKVPVVGDVVAEIIVWEWDMDTASNA